MRKLSDHFSLKELTVTSTGLDNTPGYAVQCNLIDLCFEVLEPVRKLLGCPIVVSSGYRSYEVNQAVGGKETSQHLDGNAADIIPKSGDLMTNYQRIKDSAIQYDQLILEPGWIHISTAHKPRRQAFIK